MGQDDNQKTEGNKMTLSNEEIYHRIKIEQIRMNKKYASLKGIRVITFNGEEWEFQKTNDLGVPYFSKVRKKIVQKKLFTLDKFDKKWLEDKLKRFIHYGK